MRLERRFSQAAALLREATEDVLTYMAYPTAYWRRIHSTNVLERLDRELARSCNGVAWGVFPNVAALRLLGAVLEEQEEEWLTPRRYFSPDSMANLQPPAQGDETARQQAPAEATAS